jgi:small-conductance mechanosensitive channel
MNLALPAWLAAWASDQIAPLTTQPWLQAALVCGAGLVLAKAAAALIQFGAKFLTRRTSTLLDDEILKLLGSPLTWSALLLSFAVSGWLVIDNPAAAAFVERVFLTFLVLVWVIFIFRTSRLLLRTAAGHPVRFQMLRGPAFPLFDNAVKLVVFFVASWMFIQVWNFDTTGWLASAGILGIAVGFAAQETLANLFAGVFILADKPYKVGDFIVLDTGERGQVSLIGLRSTRLLTADDVEITIPNRQMGQAKIVNQSGGPYLKIRVGHKVGVAYGSDLQQVRQVLLSAAASCPFAEATPVPVVRFLRFGDSSLEMELYIWISSPEEQVAASDDLNERMYLALNQAGIGIPFPQRELWIREQPAAPPRPN